MKSTENLANKIGKVVTEVLEPNSPPVELKAATFGMAMAKVDPSDGAPPKLNTGFTEIELGDNAETGATPVQVRYSELTRLISP